MNAQTLTSAIQFGQFGFSEKKTFRLIRQIQVNVGNTTHKVIRNLISGVEDGVKVGQQNRVKPI